ncbi:MAG: F0F1 ATP synthase subunit gamma [Oscillospiraceae bacterium]|nr:F0F1 ATP synthase subunit gamma [Oscillospiraceae bacterium]
MAGLRELRKHLKSIRSIGQLAGAMKTVATAKYSRINAAYSAYSEYAGECRRILERFGADLAFSGRPTLETPRPPCFVVLGGNRGLCGSYNIELMSLFAKTLAQHPDALIVACGKIAVQYCREKNISVCREFIFNDVPDYSEAKELSEYLRSLYAEGKTDSIQILYQKFVNMLTQTPVCEPLLPCGASAAAEEDEDFRTVYIPDRETVLKKTILNCIDSAVYDSLLECAAGSQAATIMAMRSAYDNSQESSDKLETKINRIRQGEVTADVIEISYEPPEE